MSSPQALLDDAKALNDGQAKTAERRRTIISRCYYATYHYLQSHECASGFRVDRSGPGGIHKRFITYLAGSAEPNVRYAARKLQGIYVWRIKADYRLDPAIPRGQEVFCMEDAEEVFNDILLEYDPGKDVR